MSKRSRTLVTCLAALLLIGGSAAAQSDPSMSFFVTSVGNGADGGNYGGLAGADARCQSFAGAVGAGDLTWRAYLSTVPIDDGLTIFGELIHARDRIGEGPWYNFDGDEVASDVDDLHASQIPNALMLTELGPSSLETSTTSLRAASRMEPRWSSSRTTRPRPVRPASTGPPAA